MHRMILNQYFLSLTVLTVINGEYQNVFSCDKSQVFCEIIRKCVERRFVCNGFIKYCSDPAYRNASNELDCLGVYSESHLKTQVCPENWFGPWKRSCYFFRPNIRKSWFSAYQECRNLHSQAKLASSSVSAKALASYYDKREWTDFIWIGEDERQNSSQKRSVTAITRGKYWNRPRRVKCPALSLRNLPGLFTQNFFEERSCNKLRDFVCELPFPEVKDLKTGNYGSAVPDTPLQVSAEAKTSLTRDMGSGNRKSTKISAQPIKINSRTLVQDGSNFSTHGQLDLLNSSVTAPSMSHSAIVLNTISPKSLGNHEHSTFDVQETTHWKDEFAIKNGDERRPLFIARRSRKLEKSGTVRTVVNVVSRYSVLSTQTLPLLPPAKVWSQDDRMPWARVMLKPGVFGGAWGLRGARQGGTTLLSSHTSMVTGTIFISESNATSNSQSTSANQTVNIPTLASLSSRTILVTAEILSVSATGQYITPSLTIKPTPSLTSTVNHTSSAPFTEPLTQGTKPITKASTGFVLPQTATVGLAAGGGKA